MESETSTWEIKASKTKHLKNGETGSQIATGILNTCTRLWLTESEQATPMDSIKDVV